MNVTLNVYCTRSVMFVGTSIYMFSPKHFGSRWHSFAWLKKFPHPPQTHCCFWGSFMAITLWISMRSLQFQFWIHLTASHSFAAVHFDGTCECILSMWHAPKYLIPRRGIVITKLCWDKTSQHLLLLRMIQLSSIQTKSEISKYKEFG